MTSARDEQRRISASLTDPRVIDPRQELVRHDDLSEEELGLFELDKILRDLRRALAEGVDAAPDFGADVVVRKRALVVRIQAGDRAGVSVIRLDEVFSEMLPGVG